MDATLKTILELIYDQKNEISSLKFENMILKDKVEKLETESEAKKCISESDRTTE